MISDPSLEANERNEVTTRALGDEIVGRPVVLLGDTFDFNRHGITGVTDDHDVDTLLVAEREVGGQSDSMEAGEDVELGRKVRVVATHSACPGEVRRRIPASLVT